MTFSKEYTSSLQRKKVENIIKVVEKQSGLTIRTSLYFTLSDKQFWRLRINLSFKECFAENETHGGFTV
jgi:hypothetical protein